MSLHRVDDNTILDKKEYEEHVDAGWALCLFIVGTLTAGYGVYQAIEFFGLNNYPKWVRFSSILSIGLICGFLLACIRKLVQMALFISVIIAIFGGAGYLVWVNM